MRISFQALESPQDLAIEKFASWIRLQLKNINAELPLGTYAEVRLLLPLNVIHCITTAAIDDLIQKEVDRHSQILRIIVEGREDEV